MPPNRLQVAQHGSRGGGPEKAKESSSKQGTPHPSRRGGGTPSKAVGGDTVLSALWEHPFQTIKGVGGEGEGTGEFPVKSCPPPPPALLLC